MKRNLLSVRTVLLSAIVALTYCTQAQTTISSFASGTNYTGANGVSGNSAITFAIQNSSGSDILLTSIDNFLQTVNNNTNVTLWYSTTSLSGAPTIATPTWTQLATAGPIAVPSNGVYPHFTGLSLLIPNGSTYRFAIQSSNGIRYSGASPVPSPYVFTTGGVSLLCGGAQISGLNVGYGGAFPSPPNNPRAFTGAITFVAATQCSGQPTPGNTTSSANPVCPSAPFQLGIQNANQGSGVNYQWQSSTNGVSWTNISGATTSSYTATQTASTYYRAVLVCTNSSLSDTSTPLLVTMNSFINCYCAASGGTCDEAINQFTLNTINNSSGCTGGYANFTSISTTLVQGASYPVSVFTTQYFSGDQAYVWVDWDQNGIFADPAERTTLTDAGGSGFFNGTLNVPNNAIIGNTRLRARMMYTTYFGPCGTGNFGEVEDYTVNIIAPPSCTNPPNAGTISATSVCSGATSSLISTGYDIGTTLQWQISPDSISWTDVPGAVNAFLTTAPVVGLNYYRLRAICTDTAYSNVLAVQPKPFYQCYCNTALGGGGCNGEVINNVTIATTTLNNNSTCNGTFANTYTAFPDTGSATATLYQGNSYNLSVTLSNAGIVSVWIDFNQNGTFEPSEWTQVTTNSASPTVSITIPSNALLGKTGMRIRSRATGNPNGAPDACTQFGSGETEDYIITIATAPPCGTTPVAGTVSGSSVVNLPGQGTYSTTGSVGSIAWQYSTVSPNGPWLFFGGASGTPVNITFTIPGTYYIRAWASDPGCPSDSSNVITTTVVLTGDDVCGAIPITVGTNGPYSTAGATVQVGEPAPPAAGCAVLTGWCNSTLNGTLWFTLVAPPSGRVSIRTPGTSGNSDSQIALWDAPTCASILTSGATLIAANDDAAGGGGFLFSSFLDSVICLTPGKTYYLQLDKYGATEVITTVIVTDLGPGPNASFNNLNYYQCAGGGQILLTPNIPGGSFFGVGIVQDTILDLGIVQQQLGIGVENVIYYQLYACYQTTDTIVISSPPSISVGGTTNVSCFGGSNGAIDINTSGNGPFTFGWSNGATTEDISGLTANDYSLTVTDAGGCVNTSSLITITQPTALVPTLDSVVNTSCFGATNGGIYISVSGGTPPYTYQWSNGSTGQDLTGVGAGVYTGTLSDALGCLYNSPQIPISEPAQIVVTIDSTTNNDCFGGASGRIYTTVQSGGVAPFTFAWSNNATTDDISALTAGNYTLTVTDANACTLTISGAVSQPNELMAMLDNQTNVTCPGGNNGVLDISSMGGTGSVSYLWNNGSTSQDINNLTASTYTVILTDVNNCSASASYVISEPLPISIASTVSNVSCFGGSNGAVTLNVSGGTPSYGYSWSNNTTSQNLTGVGAGSYTVVVTDSNNCSASASVTVTAPSAPLSGTTTKTDQIQNGMMGSVDLTVTGGTAPYLYNWSNGATTQDLASVAAATYTVTITDANGCTATASATVGLIIGLEEAAGTVSVSIYPNPTPHTVFVDLNATNVIYSSVEVYNLTGQLIKTGFTSTLSTARYEIDMGNEAEGVYLLKIKAGEQTIVRRVVVSR